MTVSIDQRYGPRPTVSTPDVDLPAFDGLGQLLPRLVESYGDRTALATDGRNFTFAELNEISADVSAALAARGIGPGDTVAVLSPNRWEWIAVYHGILKLGGVVVPLNAMLTTDEVAFIVRDAGAKVVFIAGEALDAVGTVFNGIDSVELVISFDEREDCLDLHRMLAENSGSNFEPRPVDSASLACVAYTSGTTGRPKGTMQSHRSLVLNCAYTATMHGRTADDVVVTSLPAAHVYGNVVINSTLLAGGRIVLLARFDPATALAAIETHRATMFEGVPAMYAMMLASQAITDASLSSLRRCTVGGQTVSAHVITEWEQRSRAPLIETWGMTELSGAGTTHAVYAPNVRGSIGIALPGVELRVAALDGRRTECAPGEAGELMVRGPIVTMGYLNNPKATAESVTPEGWLHTGDLATHDGTGHFFVIDRLKDVIITSGYNIYPAEIERVLIGHEAVTLVAVGREPHDVKGEVAHAYVVRSPGHEPDADDLLAYCRQRLAAYKVPRAIHFVDQLPTTSSGKLIRRALRQPTADVIPSID
ncbi:MAG TPA: AMP-binding protein [Mycobacterium sp.]